MVYLNIQKCMYIFLHFLVNSCQYTVLIPLSSKHANHTYSINTQENNYTHSKTKQQKVVAAVLKIINNQCSRHPMHLKADVHSIVLSCSCRNTEIFCTFHAITVFITLSYVEIKTCLLYLFFSEWRIKQHLHILKPRQQQLVLPLLE